MVAGARLYTGTTTLVIDGRQLQDLLTGRNGPVVRDTIRRADRVVAAARGLAPVGRVRPDRPGGPRGFIPGQGLREGIVKREAHDSLGFLVLVGSVAPHSGYVSHGTEAHIIRPVRAKHLVFYWPKAGRVVAFPQVNHPGTKPNDYLQRALLAAEG